MLTDAKGGRPEPASDIKSHPMTEAEAVLHCQNKDQEAFTVLYDAYVKNIYQFIFYKTHHKEIAEDLTSITFIKALEKIKTFNSKKASFKTWIYQIARNTVTDHYRKHREMRNIDDIWDLSTTDDIEAETDVKMKLEEVQKYLKKLKPDQREVVLLRVWGGHGFAEIAEMTGKTEAACKMTFKRTVEKLRGDMVILMFLIYFI